MSKKYLYIGIAIIVVFIVILWGYTKVGSIAMFNGESNVFSIDDIKVGQNIGEFKVLSVGPVSEKLPYNNFNAQVEFEGDVKLSGTYDYRYSEMPGAYLWFFYPDKESKKRIPVLRGNKIYNIGLEGRVPILESFKTDTKGTITLEISKLHLIYYPSTGWHTMVIKRIINKTEEPV